MLNPDAIVAERISKRFGKIDALKDVSFKVNEKEIHGYLGPNGAGKTTTIKILSTLLVPDSGKAYVNGFDVVKESNKVKQHIAVLMQWISLDETLSVEENLYIYGKIHGISSIELRRRVSEVVEEFGLTDLKRRIVATLSMGQQRLVQLSRIFLLERDIVILDEPTSNLDPTVRRIVWDIIRKWNKRGKTFLISTHYIHEAEFLCNRVSIINKGVVIASGTIDEFREKIGKFVLELRTFKEARENKRILNDLLKKYNLTGGYVTSMSVVIVSSKEDTLRNIVIEDKEIGDFEIRPLSLEDVFLVCTGEGFWEAWKYDWASTSY